jgi:hypothetical protein
MRRFNGQIHWQGIGTTAVVALFGMVVLAFTVDRYIEWPSSTAAAALVNATGSSASNLNPGEPSAQTQSLKGKTACALGKRSPPTQLMPLPQ